MELQTFGDRTHVIHSARQRHTNDAQNRPLQNVLLTMLQEEESEKAKRVLIVLCDLHRRRAKDAADCSDTDSSEDEKNPQAVLQREDDYKAHQKEKDSPNYYSRLNHLIDAHGFAKKLFSRLQTCNKRFEVRMMILKVIEQTVGLHRLILLNFYPFPQKCVQPHQRDITACISSSMVNQFVHDKARTEEITVGLNAAREIFLLMTKRSMPYLVLHRNSHEKAISTAACSLITSFREVCPSWLVKKDRGRPSNPKAQPKAFTEVNIASNVSGLELLQNGDEGPRSKGT
ncbi:hypothetical protein MKX03_001052 [Papaver bracteatum]|nr:hypothetical protein MKX03_001052 [Papaver bracteatum]